LADAIERIHPRLPTAIKATLRRNNRKQLSVLTHAIVSNSLSLHSGSGPGRLNNGAISPHRQKSSRFSIIIWSLRLAGFGLGT